MSTPEEDARQATLRFYDALDDLILGKGTEAMSRAWHHDDSVTTVHPFGHWAQGWQEIAATWEEIAAMYTFYHGHDGRDEGVGAIHELRVMVMGDVAYTTGVYKAHWYGMPGGVEGMNVNCTNVLHKRDGVWKIVHHHADQAPPEVQAALAQMVESGQQ